MLTVRSNVALACVLSGLAGYVDGVGFLHLGGLFVSFMSGNTTRLGVGYAEGNFKLAHEALILIGVFVVGAGAGTLVVSLRTAYRRAILMLFEALLLTAAGLLYHWGRSDYAVYVVVFAMGLENAMFHNSDGGGIALTYVTGALVRVGQSMAAALLGGPRWAWVPHLLLWASLATGSVLGALAYHRFNLVSVWFASGAALLVACVVAANTRLDEQ